MLIRSDGIHTGGSVFQLSGQGGDMMRQELLHGLDLLLSHLSIDSLGSANVGIVVLVDIVHGHLDSILGKTALKRKSVEIALLTQVPNVNWNFL